MDEAMDSVSQYSVTWVSRKSRVNRDSTSPPQSLQFRRRSSSHAARPTGESASAQASVWWSLECTVRWETAVSFHFLSVFSYHPASSAEYCSGLSPSTPPACQIGGKLRYTPTIRGT